VAKMREVFLLKPTNGPDEYTSSRAALLANPSEWVPVAHFATEDQAKGGARRINVGSRDGTWPRDVFYGAYTPNPSPKGEPDENGLVEDAWLVVVGVRSAGIPEGWQAFVNGAGSRKRKSQNDESSTDETLVEEEDVSEEAPELEAVAA